ncbi:hypothetical protein MNBD_ACTINO01-1525 [hydrothermal vent metagenome]|uniref:Uncharacterized protein n=1 Tax=hydrothermal vent metagenome TaxID=652676 RepID=A0A3B0STF4_9ZZZZ
MVRCHVRWLRIRGGYPDEFRCLGPTLGDRPKPARHPGATTSWYLEDTPDRILVLDTKVPHRWESVDHNAIDSVAQRRPNVEAVDWNSCAGARPELFTRAQVHANPKGQVTCAGLFDRTINRN